MKTNRKNLKKINNRTNDEISTSENISNAMKQNILSKITSKKITKNSSKLTLFVDKKITFRKTIALKNQKQ